MYQKLMLFALNIDDKINFKTTIKRAPTIQLVQFSTSTIQQQKWKRQTAQIIDKGSEY